jgi:hypothetical protein
MASSDPYAVAQLKLLAELPHLGNEPVAEPTTPVPQNRKFVHAAFAEPHDEPVAKKTSTLNKRYVDRAHLEVKSDHDYLEPQVNCHRTHQSLAHRHSSQKPTSKSVLHVFLTGAHQQVAPFAGLIVTAAIVATAGLLFHMMSSGSNSKADLDEFALPSFEVEAIGKSLSDEESLPLADVSPTPEISSSENINTAPEDILPSENVEQKMPALGAHTPNTPPSAEVEIESTATLGQLAFPQTQTPLALDYTKASDPDLQRLPEVAERTEATTTEGINR